MRNDDDLGALLPPEVVPHLRIPSSPHSRPLLRVSSVAVHGSCGSFVAMRLPAFLTDDSPLTRSRLWPRWLFLRALGLIFLSAFYSLAFQIRGLIGEHGILPTTSYLQQLSGVLGA